MPVELSAAGGEGQPRPLVLGPGRTTTVDAASSEGGGKIKIHDSRELAYDLDGDGMLDEKEVLRLVDQKAQGDRTIAHMTKGLAILAALLVVFFGISIGSVVHSVNVASEGQAKVSGTNELIAADGVAIAVTAVAVEDAPLYIIPVLPDDVIKRIGSITVSVDMSADLDEPTPHPNGTHHHPDNSSGTGADDDDDTVTAFSTGLPPNFNIDQKKVQPQKKDRMEYTFNIATFAKVNSTCAILSSAAGDVLFLNAGSATLTFGAASAFSGSFATCSASASCARTSVNGIDIAGYVRAADAALASAGFPPPISPPISGELDHDGGRQRRTHPSGYTEVMLRQLLSDYYDWCKNRHSPGDRCTGNCPACYLHAYAMVLAYILCHGVTAPPPPPPPPPRGAATNDLIYYNSFDDPTNCDLPELPALTSATRNQVWRGTARTGNTYNGCPYPSGSGGVTFWDYNELIIRYFTEGDNAPNVVLDAEWTVSVWVKSNSNQAGAASVQRLVTGSEYPTPCTCAGNEVPLYFRFGGAGTIIEMINPNKKEAWMATSLGAFSIVDQDHSDWDAGCSDWSGTWHHHVYQDDGSQYRVWVDGVQVSDSPFAPPANFPSGSMAGAQLHAIGGSNDYAYHLNPNYGLCGSVDELAIWNRPLSDAEVAGVYALRGLDIKYGVNL